MPDDHPAPTEEILFDAFPPVSTEAWRKKIEEDLNGADFDRRLVWRPPEGFAVQPFYRLEDLDALPDAHVRLLASTRPSTNAWHVRQNVAVADVVTANQQAQDAVASGAESLGFLLTDSPVATEEDLTRLLEDLPLGETAIHVTGTPVTRPLLAMLLNEAIRRGLPHDALTGSVTYDPMAALAQTGALPVQHAFDELAWLVSDVETLGASLHVLGIDAQPYHEAGASAVHELACTLAAASETLAHLTDRGLPVEAITRRMRFTVPVDTRYFMEIAKLRALRLLYARLVQAFDSRLPATRPYVDAVTSRWSLTLYDPHANLLRATTEAASAIVGGCDELTLRPFDAATKTPTGGARRLARNIQLILRHEAHLDKVSDPAAGSYYLEVLTDMVARHAWAFFQEIEARGGLLAALQEGFVQQAIRQVREDREQAIAQGQQVFVGVNRYPDIAETRLDDVDDPNNPVPGLSTSPPRYIETPRMLANLREEFREGYTLNDLPAVTEAPVTVDPLPMRRGAAAFEKLRLRTEACSRTTGHRPTVFVLMTGDPAMASARATFARNFFGCAGFPITEERFESAEAGAQAALTNKADIVVLCSADPDYATVGPAACDVLKSADAPPLLVIAGRPDDLVDDLQDAGVDAFIHRMSPLLEMLENVQHKLGIPE